MPSEWTHKYVATRTTPGPASQPIKATRTTVTAGLHHLDGNPGPYFSISCSIEEQANNNRWLEAGGGAAHETIARLFPRLAPIIGMHMASEDGAPMHDTANAIYHAGFSGYADARNVERLAKHLRISPEDARALIDRCERAFTAAFIRGQGDAREIAGTLIAEFVDAQRPRWAEEARAAIALLDELIEQQASKVKG
jgi:hypothetical protein